MENITWFYVDGGKFDNVQNKPGVYLITVTCIGEKPNDYVIYSGQSVDMHKRCLDHWASSEPNKELADAIKKYNSIIKVYYVYVDEKNLDGCERYLFNCFSPQLQERKPDVDPIEIKLPPEVRKGKVNL